MTEKDVRERKKRRRFYNAPVTCMNCGTSGVEAVAKGTTLKDALTEGLKCSYCDCAKLKPNIPAGAEHDYAG